MIRFFTLLISCVSVFGASPMWYAPTTNELVLLPAVASPTIRTTAMLGGLALTNGVNGGPLHLVPTNGLTIDLVDTFPSSLANKYWARIKPPFVGVPDSRLVTAGAGLTGGGDLSADRTFDVGAGTGITVNANDVALDTASTRNTDHTAVTLTAGAGLTGGGDISANRTFTVGAGTGITVNADDVAIANTAVTPGPYGANNTVATFTVDQQGRLTAAAEVGIASLAASVITSGTIATARLGSGTADGTTFLRGDQTWAAPSGSSGANPSATIGLSAVNGAAGTFLRSDGAPALSQAIVPTWTGLHTFNTGVDVMNSSKLGVGTTTKNALLHVMEGGTATAALGGVSTWFQRSANAADNSYIGIISGTSGSSGILFGDTGDQDIGLIYYNHVTDAMVLRANNSDWVTISSAGVVNLVQATASRYVKTDGSKNLTTTATETANTVFAGPTSGAAAVPAFRALVADDLPVGLSGLISPTRGDMIYSSVGDTWDRFPIGTTGKFIRSDGTDPSWQTIVASDLPTSVIGDTGSGEFSVSTTDGTLTTIATITPANSTVTIIEYLVVAVASDTETYNKTRREYDIYQKSGAGVLTHVSGTSDINQPGTGGGTNWDVQDSISSGSVLIRVQNLDFGSDSKTVRWTANVKTSTRSTSP